MCETNQKERHILEACHINAMKSKQPGEIFCKEENSILVIGNQIDCANMHNNQTVRILAL
jgi:hypothetical protein